MVIKIDMLRCFSAVAQHGNLVDAATQLNRSPSAVSMMLKQFEEHLGKPLFESDRKSKLTPLGQLILEQTLSELRQFDRTVKAIEGFASGEIGAISIASVPSVAATILPRALKRFMANYPNVRIELRDMDSMSVLRELQQERVDIGIATAPDSLPDERRTRLLSDAFGLVCARDHPLAQSDAPLTWQAIQGETFIANELCSTLQSPVFRAIYDTSVLAIHNTLSLLAMVKAGLGVTVLPQMVAQMSPDETAFRPIDDAGALRQIDLLHAARNSRSPVADAFCEAVVDAVEDSSTHD